MKALLVFVLGVLIGGGVVFYLRPTAGLPSPKAGPGEPAHAGDPDHEHEKPEVRTDEALVRLSDAARKAAGLRVAQVEKRRMGPVVQATGVIRPDADQLAHVSPKVTGRILDIKAWQGTQVRRGDPLLVLDSIEMGEAAAEWLKARSALDVAKINFEREEELMKRNATRGADYYEARSQHLRTQADAQATRGKLLLLGWTPEQIDGLSWGEPGKMSQITVFAPLDGEVIEKHATLGEVVKPETILYVIAGLSKVWVELNLYPEDFRSVHKGQAVETATDAVPGKVFQGRVTYVGQFFADETRTLKVRVELNNEQGLLKSGMYVTAHIRDDDEQHVRECLCVPVAAVVQIEERPVVFVAKAPGVFERRAVTLGKRFGEHHEVLVGLEENETVVTEGAFILKSELLRAQMSHDHPH